MSDLDPEAVAKMKVAELRTALGDYGLDTKGTKPILVARLQSYLESQPSQNAEAAVEEESAEPGEFTDISMYFNPFWRWNHLKLKILCFLNIIC